MLGQAFRWIFVLSWVGSGLALILFALKPLTQKIFSGRWHYYIWLIVLLTMILPVRAEGISKKDWIFTPEKWENKAILTERIPVLQSEKIEIGSAAESRTKSSVFLQEKLLQSASAIWLMGAVFLLAWKIGWYLAYLRKVCKAARSCSCKRLKQYTGRPVAVKISSAVRSPLLVGIWKPTLFMPKIQMTEKQFHSVLCHEMTHLKRQDLLYKWFAFLIQCIHWFNPIIYFVCRQIDMECEISCDMAVVKKLSQAEKCDYMRTIFNLHMAGGEQEYAFTAGMAGGKKMLKKRFLAIKGTVHQSKTLSFAAVSAAGIFVGLALLGSCMGIALYGEASAEEASIPSIQKKTTYKKANSDIAYAEYDVFAENEGHEILYTEEEKPEAKEQEFIERRVDDQVEPETMTEPLTTEGSRRISVEEQEHSEETENEVSENTVPRLMEKEESKDADVWSRGKEQREYGVNAYELERRMTLEEMISLSGKRLSEEKGEDREDGGKRYGKPLNLCEACRTIDYNLDIRARWETPIYPDRDGRIALFFETDFSEAVIDVSLYEGESQQKVISCSIPTESNRVYYLEGLIPQRLYTLMLTGYHPGNYKIKGRAFIY